MSSLISFVENVVLPALIGAGGAWVVAGYLSKKLIEQKLSKELEGYKNQLSTKTEALKIKAEYILSLNIYYLPLKKIKLQILKLNFMYLTALSQKVFLFKK